MAKAIFEIPFTYGIGLDFNGYLPLAYDTGETITVQDIDENGVLFDKVVPLVKGGFTVLENIDVGDNQPQRVLVETSPEKIQLIKNDPNYVWVKDLGEDE
jgi:hypothetical protein